MAAVSNFHHAQMAMTIAVNLPPNSSDVHFYFAAPRHFSYVAMGFGSQMASSLMLIAYPAADGKHITVSPRLATGHTEPAHSSSTIVSLNSNSTVYGDYLVASGTCSNCRSWPGGSLDSNTDRQPMMYALGPHPHARSAWLASDDPAVPLRRHSVYGRFLLSTRQATGSGGTGVLTSVNNGINRGVLAYGDGSLVRGDSDRLALAHGLVLAVAVGLVVAPVDVFLGSQHLHPRHHQHALVDTAMPLVYLGLLITGLGLGGRVSASYLALQTFSSPHQALGLVVFFLGLLLIGLRVALRVASPAQPRLAPARAADSHGLLSSIQVCGMGILWILVLVNGGLGLQLADASRSLILGYAVLSAAALLTVLLSAVYLRCHGKTRRQRQSSGSRKTPRDSTASGQCHEHHFT